MPLVHTTNSYNKYQTACCIKNFCKRNKTIVESVQLGKTFDF